MMAFTTHFDEVGRKTYRPTDGLQALLEQDQITRDDLNQFRSSNKVERLIKEVLEKRGFERDDSGKWGGWVRKSKKLSCFEWAKALLKPPPFITSKAFWLVERIKKNDGPIAKATIFTIPDSSEVKLVHQCLDACGWHYEPSDDAYHPPMPKKVSVAQQVYYAVSGFMAEQGRAPNKLLISKADWNELTYKKNPFSGGAHSGGLLQYQGMSVELMPPGTKLFVGITAGVKADPQKLQGLHSVADWVDKLGHPSDLVGYATADAKPGEMVEIYLSGNQAGKTFAQFKALDEIEKTKKPRSARKPKPAPAPRKRIVPPSQLKRKLAL